MGAREKKNQQPIKRSRPPPSFLNPPSTFYPPPFLHPITRNELASLRLLASNWISSQVRNVFSTVIYTRTFNLVCYTKKKKGQETIDKWVINKCGAPAALAHWKTKPTVRWDEREVDEILEPSGSVGTRSWKAVLAVPIPFTSLSLLTLDTSNAIDDTKVKNSASAKKKRFSFIGPRQSTRSSSLKKKHGNPIQRHTNTR